MTNTMIFQDQEFKDEIAHVLPRFFPLEKMMRIALTEFRKNKKLQECSPDSIKASLLTAAQLGLEVGGISGKLYLIPFGNECTPMISYKGLCEIAWRTGKVIDLDGDIVREKDHFVARKGSSPFLEHEHATGDRGEILGAYFYAHLKDGGFKYEYLSLAEINKIGTVVSAKGMVYPKSNFWRDYFDEMAKKTAIRRLSKTLPDMPELSLAHHIEYSLEKGVSITKIQQESAALLTHDKKEPEGDQPSVSEQGGEGDLGHKP